MKTSNNFYLGIISVHIFLQQLAAPWDGLTPEESHGIRKAGIGSEAVVAGEDNTGAIPTRIRLRTIGLWAADKHRITQVVAMVTADHDVVGSCWVGHSIDAILEFQSVPILALDSYLST